MKLRLTGILGLLALFCVAAIGCGGSTAEMKPASYDLKLSATDGTVQGKPIALRVAATAMDRIAAERLTRLDDGERSHGAVLVYGHMGSEEQPLTLTCDFSAHGDLVFINKAGKAVKLFANDSNHYVPNGARGTETGNEAGPNFYSSDAPASVALFLPRGKAAEFGITLGGDVSITPDPLAMIANADPNGLTLYFRPTKLRDPDVTPLPQPVKLSTPIAITAEDRARGITDGQDSLLLLYRHEDTDWQRGGFWLKGQSGDYSIAFMRLQQGTGGGPQSFTGFVLDIVEGISDSGEDDLSRAAWWPSSHRTTARDDMAPNGGSVSGPINAVLVLRGKDAFTTRKIEESMWVLGSTMTLQNSGSGTHGNLVEPYHPETLIAKVGGKSRPLVLAQEPSAIDALISGATRVSEDALPLIAWDSPSWASAKNFGAASVQLGLLRHTGGSAYVVDRVVEVARGALNPTPISGAPSRFAVMGLNQGETVVLPWFVHHLRPFHGRAALYSGRAGDKAPNSPPSDSKVITLEIADTEPAITKGLMFRRSLPANHGMLFIFESASFKDFWMKNCLMDIDVAFVRENGTIARIHQMKKPEPGTPDSELRRYNSRTAVLYAVEMEGGWFEKNGIKEGDRLWLPPTLRQRNAK